MNSDSTIDDLVARYENLIGMYRRLDDIAAEVFRLLQAGPRSGELVERMRENAALADRISMESQEIAARKRSLLDSDTLSDDDRIRIRTLEKALTNTVQELVERETRSRKALNSRGVRIARR